MNNIWSLNESWNANPWKSVPNGTDINGLRLLFIVIIVWESPYRLKNNSWNHHQWTHFCCCISKLKLYGARKAKQKKIKREHLETADSFPPTSFKMSLGEVENSSVVCQIKIWISFLEIMDIISCLKSRGTVVRLLSAYGSKAPVI